MRIFILHIICLGLFMGIENALAQNNRECLNQALAFEKQTNLEYDSLKNSNIFMSYVVKSVTWDDEVSISNVKVHKQGDQMHFFSEQANVFKNDQEIFIVMPIQKLLIVNTVNKELNERKPSDEFLKFRKMFLDSCMIVKCENITSSTKILVLKVSPKMIETTMIETMTYEYDTNLQRIISVKTDYTNAYKLKQISMIYRDLSFNSKYEFSKLKNVFLDAKGNLSAKYKDYELVDNRDKKQKSGSK